MKRPSGPCPQAKRAYASPTLTPLGRLKTLGTAGALSSQRQPDGSFRLRFAGTEFVISIREPGTVECIPTPQAGEDWRGILEGQVQPMLLSLRGDHVFQGCAIDGGGQTFAFLGPSGPCASSLTNAFVRRGHASLGDEFLHLDISGPRVHVQPHEELVRLWDKRDASAPGKETLVHGAGSLEPRLAAGERSPHCDRGSPLSRVYLLGDGNVDAPVVHAIAPSLQLRGWAANAFVLDMENPEVLERTLAAAARLMGEVTMRGLDYPRNDDVLDDVVDAVLADLAA